jgi:hypothetical protein
MDSKLITHLVNFKGMNSKRRDKRRHCTNLARGLRSDLNGSKKAHSIRGMVNMNGF